jgi:hypothetical protein
LTVDANLCGVDSLNDGSHGGNAIWKGVWMQWA